MASKKGGGSTTNNRDSNPKYLGVKRTHGQYITAGTIIVKQRGTKFTNNIGVGLGKDHTLFALRNGRVIFHKDKSIGINDSNI